MRPCRVVVAPEVVRLSGCNLSGTDIVELVRQCQDQTTYPIDPDNENLIRAEPPSDLEVAAVAVLPVQLLGLQPVDEFLRWGIADEVKQPASLELIAQLCAGHV